MDDLKQLPNISKVLEGRLNTIGIYDVNTLKQTGSKEAFVRLYLAEGNTCYNTLCAIEGAIQGIRWHYLPDDTKKELKTYFDTVKSK